jgi:GNAT superfamily N-acetyltransferase
MSMSRSRFLDDEVDPERALRAIESHHHRWLIHSARYGGGEVRRERGVTWVYGPAGYYSSVAFPRLESESASARIDAILGYYRSRRPHKLVVWWSRVPHQPDDLEARLVARGFEPTGWINWMWLDLRHLRAEHARPSDLRVEQIEGEALWDVDDLPHYSREIAAARYAASQARPRRVWQFGAWLDGKPVGYCTLFLTTGRLGIAGIWGCGVVPAARKQGIGTAITRAACEFARELGCRYAMLNATHMGETVYRRVGFEKIGAGQTWMLQREALEAPPPTEGTDGVGARARA